MITSVRPFETVWARDAAEVEQRNEAVFDKYAQAYDDLYQDKDYQAECDFLEQIFRRYGSGNTRHILDLGCGSGGHAIPLAQRGYELFGVDQAPEMINLAQKKAYAKNLQSSILFETANIQTLKLERVFDAVISMFAVLSYQTTNAQLFATLKNVRAHLRPGGLFICDFWYGPAVLKQQPSIRVKVIRTGTKQIIRVAEPRLDIEKNIVTVSYRLFIFQNGSFVEEVTEDHRMRFLFLPELESFLSQVGLQVIHSCASTDLDQPVSDNEWNAMIVAQLK